MKYILILLPLVFSFSCATHKEYIKTPRPPAYPHYYPQQSRTPVKPPVVQSSTIEGSTIKSEALPTPDSTAVATTPNENTPPFQPTQAVNQNESSFFSLPVKKAETAVRPKAAVRYPLNNKKVGVILPLTGKAASMGQRALAAIRMGFGLNEPNPQISLALYDSQGNPELAKAGVEKLLRDENVIAILGGLSAREAQVLAERADYFEVPIFTFSQKSGLTENSDFTFQNAITPDMQANQLVSFAMQKLSMKKFAILYPNDAYGTEFANKFWDQVLARGGQITAAQVYDPKENDFTVYIQKMVGTYYPEDRAKEYAERLKEIRDRKNKLKKDTVVKKSSRENETKQNILPPIVDFDAIFIPDSSKALVQAIAFLKTNDVDSMVYLGTNLWNTPDLGRRLGHAGNRAYFVDSESSVTDVSGSDFYKNYFSQTQEEPHLLEAQTFEAAKILNDMLRGSSYSRTELANDLKSLGRRQGAFSEIRMNNSKEIERPLTILGLDQGQIQKY